MRLHLPLLPALLVSALLALSACESSEERAQRHFETGQELLAEGDVSRALVEFRNVFKLNPRHKEARMTYARVQMEAGRRADAYSQFLRVIEQYPDSIEARVELIEMAIEARNWEETERHVKAALEQDPENPRIQVANTALKYAQALRDDEEVTVQEMAEQAREALENNPDNAIARRLVIDNLLRNRDYESALVLIEKGLAQQPENYELHALKLSTHVTLEDQAAVGDTLKKMAEVFPDQEQIQQYLIQWFVEQGDNKGAENFLRELAARPDAGDDGHMAVVQFLRLTSGDEAARAEIERLIQTSENPDRFIAVQASMDFDDGETEKAIGSLEKLLADVEEPNEVTNNIKILLARMQATNANLVGARSLVEEVIENDGSHVEALKMRAVWLIDEDKTGDAIIDLRTALSQAPRDASIMTLMAAAHERAGDYELAGERYALAVELSEQAPAETLRYVAYLRQQGRLEPIAAILTEALARSPNDLNLLQAIATAHIQNEDWNEVQRVIWKLRAFETEDSQRIANAIQAEMLLQQNRMDDTIAYLENLAEGEDGMQAFVALIETQVRAGNVEDAVTKVKERLVEDPDNDALRNLRAGLHLVLDERDEAEEIYRSLLQKYPGHDRVLRVLYSMLLAADRQEDARALIDEQVALVGDTPQGVSAMMFKAELLERDREFEAAIALYEKMYEANSNNVIVANNLASLITTHRDTDESLNRAYVVARRLRGIEIPAMQDTYGWIEYRRGNYEEAVTHLEPAAKGLPNDPLVQLHLAKTYLALDRKEDAKNFLQRAVEVAGENPLPQIIEAQELLEKLSAETSE